MGHDNMIENAFLAIEDDEIIAYGKMEDWGGIMDWRDLEVIDAEGKYVLPTFCDSHTHAVFAATREEEFEDRIKGLTYEEIALKGGGILNSAARLQEMDEDTLFEEALGRIDRFRNRSHRNKIGLWTFGRRRIKDVTRNQTIKSSFPDGH